MQPILGNAPALAPVPFSLVQGSLKVIGSTPTTPAHLEAPIAATDDATRCAIVVTHTHHDHHPPRDFEKLDRPSRVNSSHCAYDADVSILVHFYGYADPLERLRSQQRGHVEPPTSGAKAII